MCQRLSDLRRALCAHAWLDTVAGKHFHTMGQAIRAVGHELSGSQLAEVRDCKRLGDWARHGAFAEADAAAGCALVPPAAAPGAPPDVVHFALEPDDELLLDCAEFDFFPHASGFPSSASRSEGDDASFISCEEFEGDVAKVVVEGTVDSDKCAVDAEMGMAVVRERPNVGWDVRLADVHRQGRIFVKFFGFWRVAAAPRLKRARRRLAGRARRARRREERHEELEQEHRDVAAGLVRAKCIFSRASGTSKLHFGYYPWVAFDLISDSLQLREVANLRAATRAWGYLHFGFYASLRAKGRLDSMA